MQNETFLVAILLVLFVLFPLIAIINIDTFRKRGFLEAMEQIGMNCYLAFSPANTYMSLFERGTYGMLLIACLAFFMRLTLVLQYVLQHGW